MMSRRKNRDGSSNNSSRTNSSSQRYVLNVSNLNVVPIDEYYNRGGNLQKSPSITKPNEQYKKGS